MKRESRKVTKRCLAFLMVLFLISINSFAAVVSDNDGSAFITQAEFDAIKADFQGQIDSYNRSIDAKIDGAVAAYLAGIRLDDGLIVEWVTDWFSSASLTDGKEILFSVSGYSYGGMTAGRSLPILTGSWGTGTAVSTKRLKEWWTINQALSATHTSSGSYDIVYPSGFIMHKDARDGIFFLNQSSFDQNVTKWYKWNDDHYLHTAGINSYSPSSDYVSMPNMWPAGSSGKVVAARNIIDNRFVGICNWDVYNAYANISDWVSNDKKTWIPLLKHFDGEGSLRLIFKTKNYTGITFTKRNFSDTSSAFGTANAIAGFVVVDESGTKIQNIGFPGDGVEDNIWKVNYSSGYKETNSVPLTAGRMIALELSPSAMGSISLGEFGVLEIAYEIQ